MVSVSQLQVAQLAKIVGSVGPPVSPGERPWGPNIKMAPEIYSDLHRITQHFQKKVITLLHNAQSIGATKYTSSKLQNATRFYNIMMTMTELSDASHHISLQSPNYNIS